MAYNRIIVINMNVIFVGLVIVSYYCGHVGRHVIKDYAKVVQERASLCALTFQSWRLAATFQEVVSLPSWSGLTLIFYI